MSNEHEDFIKELGGTTAVSRLIGAPTSTVQSWKRNGIPPWRMAQIQTAIIATGGKMPSESRTA